MIWFTSDTHFGHENVLKFTDRPWETIWQMNDAIVDSINGKVAVDDELYILWDFSFKMTAQDAFGLRKQIIFPYLPFALCMIYKINHTTVLPYNAIKPKSHFSLYRQYREVLTIFSLPLTSFSNSRCSSFRMIATSQYPSLSVLKLFAFTTST